MKHVETMLALNNEYIFTTDSRRTQRFISLSMSDNRHGKQITLMY